MRVGEHYLFTSSHPASTRSGRTSDPSARVRSPDPSRSFGRTPLTSACAAARVPGVGSFRQPAADLFKSRPRTCRELATRCGSRQPTQDSGHALGLRRIPQGSGCDARPADSPCKEVGPCRFTSFQLQELATVSSLTRPSRTRRRSVPGPGTPSVPPHLRTCTNA